MCVHNFLAQSISGINKISYTTVIGPQLHSIQDLAPDWPELLCEVACVTAQREFESSSDRAVLMNGCYAGAANSII